MCICCIARNVGVLLEFTLIVGFGTSAHWDGAELGLCSGCGCVALMGCLDDAMMMLG